MILFGMAMCCAAYGACWNVGLKLRQTIEDACSKLSNQLKTVRIRYLVYKKQKGGYRTTKIEVFHHLEVVVTVPTEASNFDAAFATHDPFFELTMLYGHSVPIREDDRCEFMGRTFHEIPYDFAAAYRAATATAPVEVISDQRGDVQDRPHARNIGIDLTRRIHSSVWGTPRAYSVMNTTAVLIN
jgi:hypothetical protein